MREVEDWNIIDDKVVYEFSDGSQKIVERSKFDEYVREMDYNLWHNQVDVDDFRPYTPSNREYKKEEVQFFDNYFKD